MSPYGHNTPSHGISLRQLLDSLVINLLPILILQVKPLLSNAIPVESDINGLNPASLRQALSKWSPSDARRPGSDTPRLLYLVPNGGNPTGAGLTLERKKEIYKIAQDYDLIILEDDPYFYLQFSKVGIICYILNFILFSLSMLKYKCILYIY